MIYKHVSSNTKWSFLGVILFHMLIFWMISTGLAKSLVKVIKTPVMVQLLEEVKPEMVLPQRLPPQTKAASPMETNSVASEVPPIASANPSANSIVSSQTSTLNVRSGPVLNAATNCPKPQYPSASRRNEEEGTVQLRFLIDTEGQVIESQVEKSSGFIRLDEAARIAISRCQFKPGMLNGKAEQSWASMKYTWRLE